MLRMKRLQLILMATNRFVSPTEHGRETSRLCCLWKLVSVPLLHYRSLFFRGSPANGAVHEKDENERGPQCRRGRHKTRPKRIPYRFGRRRQITGQWNRSMLPRGLERPRIRRDGKTAARICLDARPLPACRPRQAGKRTGKSQRAACGTDKDIEPETRSDILDPQNKSNFVNTRNEKLLFFFNSRVACLIWWAQSVHLHSPSNLKDEGQGRRMSLSISKEASFYHLQSRHMPHSILYLSYDDFSWYLYFRSFFLSFIHLSIHMYVCLH